MPTFKDREKAFEQKFVRDEALQFKVDARANKLLGLWVAEHLGKTGDDAQAYAREVIKSDFEEPGHEDVMRKVMGDLGDLVGEDEVRARFTECFNRAKSEIMNQS